MSPDYSHHHRLESICQYIPQISTGTPVSNTRRWGSTNNMIHRKMISVTISLMGLLHLSTAAGNSVTKKIQIHVPHNIQHHHHTHTKYHFITLSPKPQPSVSPNNTTNIAAFQGMIPVMPMVPILPATQPPATATPAPAINPPPGTQTNNLAPVQPAPAINPPPSIQTNNLRVGGQMQFGAPQPMGTGAAMTPMGQQQQQNFGPFVPVLARQTAPDNYNPRFYDYEDNASRRSQKYFNVEPPPTSLPPLPMKVKTVINVHETKKIPLTDILNIANLLQKDPPRRIKVDVYPEKTTHIKQNHFDRDGHQNSLQPIADGSMQHYLLSNANGDELKYDPDTAAFTMHSRKEGVAQKPEYAKLKHLLEKHIHQDFPGLKVNAEFVSQGHTLKERSDSQRSASNKAAALQASGLKHIGYVVITDKDEQRFVPLNEAQR